MLQGSTGLNAFASGRLDVELEEEATPAYGDAFAARPGQHQLYACLGFFNPQTTQPPTCRPFQAFFATLCSDKILRSDCFVKSRSPSEAFWASHVQTSILQAIFFGPDVPPALWQSRSESQKSHGWQSCSCYVQWLWNI